MKPKSPAVLKLRCVWTEDEDGVFDTACQNRFSFDTDGIKDNGFVFCPYCGKQINEAIKAWNRRGK